MKRQKQRLRVLLEEIEPRILHSADAAVLLPQAAAFAEVRLIEPLVGHFDQQAAHAWEASSAPREVVVVDAAVHGYQALVDDIRAARGAGLEVYVIDSARDGIAQLSELLDSQHDIAALHLISHGGDGELRLGSGVFDAAALARNQSEIAGWSRAFVAGADILIYGCDVAATESGRAFVDALGRVTGADVAASENLTGSAALGGNWVLEYRTGAIEAGSAIDPASQQLWTGTLAIAADPASSAATAGADTTLTFAHTAGSGVDRLLVVEVAAAGAQAVTSVTYGGVALTKLSSITDTPARNTAELWYLVAPASGTANIVVTMGASATFVAGATSFSGVVQATPFGTAVTAEGNAGTPSVTVASAVGNVVLDVVALRERTVGSADGAQTSLWTNTNGATAPDEWGGSSTAAGAASVTMGWTSAGGGGGEWAAIAVSINAQANLAPVLGAANDLAAIAEDAGTNGGTLVSDLLSGQVTDGNAGAARGIAVTGVDNANGAWQYSTNGGTSWTAFGTPSAASARLLAADASTLVRFVPAANWSGTVANGLTFRAWDQTSGAAAGTADVTTNGGSTAFSGTLASASIVVTPVNDAPVLSGANNVGSINRNAVSNGGTLVADLISGHVTEVDAGALRGIAVTAVDDANGVWQYSVNSGATWTAFGAVSAGSARLLAADIFTFVRFVPNTNWSGTVTNGLTFSAWDQTSGAAGATADTTSNGGTSAFSASSASASITVTAANTAPTLTGSNNLAAIDEDAVSNGGTLVSTIIAGHVGDVDPAAVTGIAVTAVDNTNGTWQYSVNGGTVWSSFGAPSAASARLLAADANTYVRFVPNANWTGSVGSGITFRAWDRTSGVAGSTADTSGTAGTFLDTFSSSSYSTNSGTLSWTGPWVENDSSGGGAAGGRINIAGGVLSLQVASTGDYFYREADLAGATSAWLSGTYSNNLGASARLDVQVSSNGGTSYTTIGTFTAANRGASSATMDISAYISANTRVRFYVVTGETGAGNNDFSLDNIRITTTGANGGSTAFSTATASASVTVNAVNDPPARTAGTVNNLSVAEDAAGTSLGLGALAYGAGGGTDEAGQSLTYTVTTLPSAALGTITLADGTTAVTGNTTYTLAQLRGMQFVAAANANGGPSAFAWSVSDNGGVASGGADTLLESLTITVTAVNDAPVLSGTHNLGSINRNPVSNAGTLVADLLAGHVSDVDAAPLLGIAVTGVDDTNGAWQYSTDRGTTWNAFAGVAAGTARLLAADVDTFVRFVPASNWSGTVANGLTFRAWDQSTGVAGATADTTTNGATTAFSASTASASIVVTAVNTAPTLTGSNNLSGINEDAATNTGTLVSALLAGHTNDVDPGAATGIAVTAVDDTNGTWQYSVNGGAAWTSFGAASTTSARLLAADANTYVRFVPAADWNGTVNGGITFRAWDRTTGVAGATADTSGTTGTFRDRFLTASYANSDGTLPWNGPWVESDSSGGGAAGGRFYVSGWGLHLQVAQTGDHISRSVDLSAANSAVLSFAYDNRLGAAARLEVQVSSNGGASYVTLAGGIFTAANASIGSVSLDLTAHRAADTRIRFLVASGEAAASDNAFALYDLRITARGLNGGTTAFSTASASASVVVTAVNDSPVRTAGAVSNLSVAEDAAPTSLALGLLAYGIGGAADEAAQTLTYTVTTLPSAALGTIMLADGTTAVTANTAYTLAQLRGMQFIAAANANGGPSTFAWSVTDSGGVANGGADTLLESLTITVTAVNDAPSLTNGAVVTLAGTTEDSASGAITVSSLLTASGAADVDAGAASGIAVTSTTGRGAWQYSTNGTTWKGFGPVGASNALLLASTAQIRYLPDGLDGETATFAFRAWDQTSGSASTNTVAAYANPGAGGGVSAYSTGIASASIAVAAVNDAPVVIDRGLLFDGTDVVVVPASPALVVTSALTIEATVQRSGAPSPQIILNKEGEYEIGISASGRLQFAVANAAPGWTWVETAVIVPADRAIHIAFTYDNGAAKIYVNGALADTYQGAGPIGDVHVAMNDLTIGGRQNSPVQRFVGVLDEVRVWNVARSAAEIQSAYQSSLTGAEAGLVGYWRFSETSGNVALDSSPSGVHGSLGNGVAADVPVRTSALDYVTVEESPGMASGTSVLANASDAEASALVVRLISGPAHALAFTLNADGSFSYTPTANYSGVDSFVFAAGDGVLESRPVTVRLVVTPLNDAPNIVGSVLAAVTEDALNPPGASVAALFGAGFTDADAGSMLAGVAVVANSASAGSGEWQFSSDGGASWSAIGAVNDGAGALALANATLLRWLPAANYSGTPNPLTVRALDDTYAGGFSSSAGAAVRAFVNTSASGGTSAISAATANLSTSVIAVNDAPSGSDATLTLLEDTPHTFRLADFGFSDSIDASSAGGANAFAVVRIVSLPVAGTLAFDFAPVRAGQTVAVADIVAGKLMFMPSANASGTAYATFTFQVQDDGGIANGGRDTDAAARTFTINVTPAPRVPSTLFVPSTVAPGIGPTALPPTMVADEASGAAADSARTKTAAARAAAQPAASAAPAAAPRVDLEAALPALPSASDSRTDAVATAPAASSASARRDAAFASVSESLVLFDWNGDDDKPLPQVLLAGGSGRHELIASAAPSAKADASEDKGQSLGLVTVENGVRASAIVVSAGLVTWTLHGAGIVASLLTSAPAWRHIDPLPVLAPEEEKPDWGEGDGDSVREEDAADRMWLRGDERERRTL